MNKQLIAKYLFTSFLALITFTLQAQDFMEIYFESTKMGVDIPEEVDSMLVVFYIPNSMDEDQTPDTTINDQPLFIRDKELTFVKTPTEIISYSRTKDNERTSIQRTTLSPSGQVLYSSTTGVDKSMSKYTDKTYEFSYTKSGHLKFVLEGGDTSMVLTYTEGEELPAKIFMNAGMGMMGAIKSMKKDTSLYELVADFSAIDKPELAEYFKAKMASEPLSTIKVWKSGSKYVYDEQTQDRESGEILTTKRFERDAEGRLLLEKDDLMEQHIAYIYAGDDLVETKNMTTGESSKITLPSPNATVSVSDGEGGITQTIYDERGNPTSERTYFEGNNNIYSLRIIRYWYK